MRRRSSRPCSRITPAAFARRSSVSYAPSTNRSARRRMLASGVFTSCAALDTKVFRRSISPRARSTVTASDTPPARSSNPTPAKSTPATT